MVRNLLVAMGTMGALSMGTSGRTGSASVPQQSAVPTDDLPTSAGGALKETHPWDQITTTPVVPTGGQISFRTKTRNGIRGLLPKPLKLRLWGKKSADEGLDNAKRFLHITATALVLEVEGEHECLSIDRGPESAVTARVTIVHREEAGITRGSPGYLMSISVDGLFGVYDLLSGPFLAVIRRSKLRYVNQELGVEFRQVSKVRLVPVLASPRALDEAEAREEARLLSLLALAFRSHQLYFSHAHDVTHTLQSLGVSASRAPGPAPGPVLSRSFPTALSRQGSETRSSGTPVSSSNSSTGFSPGGAMMAGSKITAKKRIRKNILLKHQKDQDFLSRGSYQGSSKEKSRRVSRSACSEGVMNMSSPPPDSRFFWNLGVLGAFLELRDRIDYRGDGEDLGGKKKAVNRRGKAAGGGLGAASVAVVDRWLTPVMSGFLQVEKGCRVGERGFDVLFVSRRSRLRQGTRFTRRGADGGGNVANFVETEQSLLYDDHSVTSHVQIRGSIPVLWSSPTNLRYRPKVKIDPDQKASLRALRLHAEDLIRRYANRGGGIVFVNLVDKKEEQGQLGEAFDAALEAVINGDDQEVVPSEGDCRDRKGDSAMRSEAYNLAGTLRHVWFDFHHECHNMHWENLDKLLVIVDREFGEQGFYHAGPDGEVLSLQDGVVRTNCMDCLDRTNVVQSLLARRSMLIQLGAVGAEMPEPHSGNSTALALTLDMLEMPAEELERRFRDVWGNNADEISILYAGTPALKSDFTRTGQRTKLGLLQDGTNSAIRYVVNNFQDHRRQEAVDLLLGLRPLPVDANGNVSNTSLKEPLDLDRWASTAPAGAETADSLGADQEEPDRYTSSKRPLVTAGLTHDAAGRSESAVDVTGRSNGDNRCSTEGKSVSIRQGEKRPPLQRRRNGDHVEGGGMRGDHRGGDAAEAAVMSGGGGGTGENAVQRVTGAALAELRMAGPYSTLALSALLLVAVGGVDLLASGGGATRVTTLLLLVGLASLPIVLSILEW